MTSSSQQLTEIAGQLTVRESSQGWKALAMMPQGEFTQHLIDIKTARDRVRAIQTAVMEDGVHFGKVPGVAKPFLHQPGAEVLCQPLRLVPTYHGEPIFGDGVTTPVISIVVECRLHYMDTDGPVVGTGRGACTTWERKYRYRSEERTCPACKKAGTVIKGKEEYGGGWLCWPKKGGCNAKFRDGEPLIEEQRVGTIENPDQFDLLQTVIAMADKRAYVKAVRTTTATSDLFTQDEDQVQGDAKPNMDADAMSDHKAAPKAEAKPAAKAPAKAKEQPKAEPEPMEPPIPTGEPNDKLTALQTTWLKLQFPAGKKDAGNKLRKVLGLEKFSDCTQRLWPVVVACVKCGTPPDVLVGILQGTAPTDLDEELVKDVVVALHSYHAGKNLPVSA
jgi:hypothetical protein